MVMRNSIALLLLGCSVWLTEAFVLNERALEKSPSLWNQEQSHAVLLPEQMDSIRSGITNQKELWPGGVVFYKWDRVYEHNGDKFKNFVRIAMDAISTTTCITFREATASDEFYILISLKMGQNVCSADVGRAGIERGAKNSRLDISSERWCFEKPDTIAHELIHAIGLWHEQQRPDRDQYITIYSQNIQGDQDRHFKIQPGTAVQGTPYDYKSIMHDSPSHLAYPGYKAFVPKPAKWDGSYIGQLAYLTKYDSEKINNLYKGICQ